MSRTGAPARPGVATRRRSRSSASSTRPRPACSGCHLSAAATPSPRRSRYGCATASHLLTDHYAPDGRALGTVLLRGPYQRTGVVATRPAGIFAARGYHVVMQSCRGTFGSEGRFVPGEDEIRDGADTVEWLREQPWFDGRFVGVGGSYLSYTLWSLLCSHRPRWSPPSRWSASTTSSERRPRNRDLQPQRQPGLVRQPGPAGADDDAPPAGRGTTDEASARTAYAGLPVSDGEEQYIGGVHVVPRLGHPVRPGRPLLAGRDLSAALDRVVRPGPVHLRVAGPFLGQTLAEYRRLRDRGVETSLTIGPWTHANLLPRAAQGCSARCWSGSTGTSPAGMTPSPSILSTYVPHRGRGVASGPDWPVPVEYRTLYLAPGGTLAEGRPSSSAGAVGLTFDPSDPTPTIGGRLLAPDAGYREDSALARRSDTLVFASDAAGRTARHGRSAAGDRGAPQRQPERRPLGPDLRGATRAADPTTSPRPSGRHRSRHGRADRLELDPVAHRFAAGSRIGLLVGGGSFPALRAQPRYARKPDRRAQR